MHYIEKAHTTMVTFGKYALLSFMYNVTTFEISQHVCVYRIYE